MSKSRTPLTRATSVGAAILFIALGGWLIVPNPPALATSETPTGVANTPAVLVIVKEQSLDMAMMIQSEVKPIIKDIADAGYVVVVASESGANIKTHFGAPAENYVELNVDKKLSEIKIEDYVGIVVPCMASDEMQGSIPPDAVKLIRTANKMGMPIAAQNAGVLILGKAGALKDRAYATVDALKDVDMGGEYEGMGVVRDGNIVTSGTCPYVSAWVPRTHDGTDVLVKVFLSMLESGRQASQ